MSQSTTSNSLFSEILLKWHDEENIRSLPWKDENDPYKIWLSEILLQQTRADHGIPYYLKFIDQYPDIQDLAAAPDDEVFLLWQGLGYYNRCKNLLETARKISSEMAGVFPSRYEDILALKGVGPYTAAAISSFAFDLPFAVLDGNVFRVLARFYGVTHPIDSTFGKKYFQHLAKENLPKQKIALYNQAIMDFGALVCKPKSPECLNCPLSHQCVAFKSDLISLLPIKEKKLVLKKRNFHYFVFEKGEKIYIQQRTHKDIWQNLYEFYLIEAEDYQQSPLWPSLQEHVGSIAESTFTYQQRLTHQILYSTFHLVLLKSNPPFLEKGAWILKRNLRKFSFPKTILSFLELKHYF